MHKVREATCIRCHEPVLATEDESYPLCDDCGYLRSLIDLKKAVMAGEVPGMSREDYIGEEIYD